MSSKLTCIYCDADEYATLNRCLNIFGGTYAIGIRVCDSSKLFTTALDWNISDSYNINYAKIK